MELQGWRLAAMALALMASAGAANAADTVETHLDARGERYDIDEEGDFQLFRRFQDSGRKQVVYVYGAPQSVDGFKVRRVTSPAARIGNDGIDDKVAGDLMRRNADSRLGSWSISGDWVSFDIILPDDMTADELMAAIDLAARTADALEKEFSGALDHF